MTALLYNDSPYCKAQVELLRRATLARAVMRHDPGLNPLDMLAAVVWGKGAPRVPRSKETAA